MKELKIHDKQKYLEENYPFQEVPELADRKRCIHCDSNIIVGNYKVFVDEFGDEFMSCPNAPQLKPRIERIKSIHWIDLAKRPAGVVI